jgi:ATP-dependent Lon protease
MEFYDAHFSLINQETLEEQFVSVTEQSGGKLIPEGLSKPGHVYAVTRGATDLIGVFKMELQVAGGSGKFERTGLGSNSKTKESLNMAFNYFKANSKNVSGNIGTTTKDFQLHVQNLQGLGIPDEPDFSRFYHFMFRSVGTPHPGTAGRPRFDDHRRDHYQSNRVGPCLAGMF